ncbi:MAG: hypothetical protein CBE08_005850 [Euryarchaeota archaeon TMED248]|nr:MAG: hypothetical protein CBE08_005850 [Euryarchaeota archaeon TMED248]|tara:strand:- start:2894 stop:3724 length:831 start_codon:yes stop_codon:yes gene_type:complete
MENPGARIILLGRDLELRIISLIVRAREISQEVVFFDLGSKDETIELAEEVGCPVYSLDSEPSGQDLSKYILQSDLDSKNTNLLIKISDDWKLSDFPIVENRAKESWDIFIAFSSEESEVIEDANQIVLNSIDFSHMVLSEKGLNELSKTSPISNALELDENLKVRVTRIQKAIRLPQRESLASASRFAQLFYWMLETRHPLLLFGIPGIVLFGLGYKLSGNVLDTFSELNTTSIGVTLTTIAMTLVGLFAMMVALILYIMGKQVEQIQSQYDWSR